MQAKLNELAECCSLEIADKLFKCHAFQTRFQQEDFARHFKCVLSMVPPHVSEFIIEFYMDESFCTETSSYDQHGHGNETLNEAKRMYALELIRHIMILAKNDQEIVRKFLTICHEASQKNQANPLFPSLKQCNCKQCSICIDSVKTEDCLHPTMKKWISSDVCECKRCFMKNKNVILESRRQDFLISLPSLLF